MINEIVAHATAAIRCDADQAARTSPSSRSAARTPSTSGSRVGRIVESDMNKACSAGTGSFLEEQAASSTTSPTSTEFIELAKGAERPPDLGQMCTVYVADAAAEALKDGLRSGRHLRRLPVLGHPQLPRSASWGRGPWGSGSSSRASPPTNPSLAWTLAAVTGQGDRRSTQPWRHGSVGDRDSAPLIRSGRDASCSRRQATRSCRAFWRPKSRSARSPSSCRDSKCQTLLSHRSDHHLRG